MLMARLQGILAPRTDEATVLLALHASAMEKPLTHRRVVAIAHGGDHVTAIVAQVFDGFLPRDVALVRHQDPEDEHERADDQADHPALQARVILEREGGPRPGHAPPSRLLIQILNGGNIVR